MARRHDLFACGAEDKFYMWKRIGIMRIINSRMGIINNLVRGNIFFLIRGNIFILIRGSNYSNYSNSFPFFLTSAIRHQNGYISLYFYFDSVPPYERCSKYAIFLRHPKSPFKKSKTPYLWAL